MRGFRWSAPRDEARPVEPSRRSMSPGWAWRPRRRLVFHGVPAAGVVDAGTGAAAAERERQRSQQRYAQGFRKTLGEVVAGTNRPASWRYSTRGSGRGPRRRRCRCACPMRRSTSMIRTRHGRRWSWPVAACAGAMAIRCASRWAATPTPAASVYLVGLLDTPPLQPREQGSIELSAVHRARVSVDYRGQVSQWVARPERLERPEREPARRAPSRPRPRRLRPRRRSAAGSLASSTMATGSRCATGRCAISRLAVAGGPVHRHRHQYQHRHQHDRQHRPRHPHHRACRRRTLISIRLPVEVFREAFVRPAGANLAPADTAADAYACSCTAGRRGAALRQHHQSAAAFTLQDLRARAVAQAKHASSTPEGPSAKAQARRRRRSAAAAPRLRPLPAALAAGPIRRLPGRRRDGPLQATPTPWTPRMAVIAWCWTAAWRPSTGAWRPPRRACRGSSGRCWRRWAGVADHRGRADPPRGSADPPRGAVSTCRIHRSTGAWAT